MKSAFVLVIAVVFAAAARRFEPRASVPNLHLLEPPRYGIFLSEKVSISAYPYTAAILTDNNELIGGGFIYKHQWVISSRNAGTLMPTYNMTVRVGSNSSLEGGQLFKVSKVFNQSVEYCASIIKLGKKIKFGKNAKPIKIANISPKGVSKGHVTGWGETGTTEYEYQLHRRNTDILDRDYCRDHWFIFVSGIGPMEMCAMGSSCYGDHGDPLVQNGKALGVFVYDRDCSRDYAPVVYCNLPLLRNWIDLTIRNDKHTDNKETATGIHTSSDHKTYDYNYQFHHADDDLDAAAHDDGDVDQNSDDQ